MNNLIKQIVESKYNFNIDIEGNESALSKSSFNPKSQKLLYEEYTYVDLGLPSGTKWCKYNLGANTETDYGDYYSWGELTTYTGENYDYKNKPKHLFPEYDVATLTLGNNYSIPTRNLFNELCKYTINEWVENYKRTDVNGMLFTGKNNNSIFIPAAGYHAGPHSYSIGSSGNIWSSSLYSYDSNYAWLLNFKYSSYYRTHASLDCEYRSCGLSIRPVYKKEI